ncbi:hypothetical protein [Desulfobacula sp.]|uniref:hypothetical protein n=1 Tax=Desulfobacula sp. TaxID=2593537 RepID=UPI0025C60E17|nr:hypothetical protein [Desulfobacula sp.]MBC2705017.1 hypothetical protein [Desulfobacula sp.]
MVNKEIKTVLDDIRSLKKKVQIRKANADHPAKKELEDVYIILDDLEDDLTFSELEKKVENIERSSKKLKSVIKKAKEKSDDIDDIVRKIDKITDVLDKIADIAGKGASIV